jgi:hypothetical protein
MSDFLTSHIDKIPTTEEGLAGAIYAAQYFREVYTCDCPKDAATRTNLSEFIFELRTRFNDAENDQR